MVFLHISYFTRYVYISLNRKFLLVDIMKEYMEKKSHDYPSLYDAFQLGDRVMRSYKDKCGKKTEYKGIILKIEKNSIEVYWDTKDGKYEPGEMGNSFTNCKVEEIFRGDGDYTPIKKEKSFL